MDPYKVDEIETESLEETKKAMKAQCMPGELVIGTVTGKPSGDVFLVLTYDCQEPIVIPLSIAELVGAKIIEHADPKFNPRVYRKPPH